MRGFDAAEAKRLREAPKDARGQQVRWRETKTPSGLVVRKHLAFTVEANPGPTTGHLLVEGVWKAPEQIQIFLYVVDGASQTWITRLCQTPKHSDDLHFHDERNGITPPLSEVPGIIDENTMLHDVFVPTMNITNLPRPML